MAYNSSVSRFLARLTSTETDGNLVLRLPNPPYKNLTDQTIHRGNPNITFIIKQDCTACFTPDLFITLFRAYGIYSQNAFVLLYGSQKAARLIEEYNITAVPTVIIGPAGQDYLSFIKEAWPYLGTIEPDGSLVFRNVSQIGASAYYNIPRNETLLT
jgi:hypothetical protein